jgi:hypothetical protein
MIYSLQRVFKVFLFLIQRFKKPETKQENFIFCQSHEEWPATSALSSFCSKSSPTSLWIYVHNQAMITSMRQTCPFNTQKMNGFKGQEGHDIEPDCDKVQQRNKE